MASSRSSMLPRVGVGNDLAQSAEVDALERDAVEALPNKFPSSTTSQ